MRLEIRYVTSFDYPGPVRESHNVLRARPISDDHQRVVSYRVTTDPQARIMSYVDYWGTTVDTFGVRSPHDRLTVVADSAVVTSPRPAPSGALSPEAYAAPDVRDGMWQYLQPTPHVAWDGDVTALGAKAVAGASRDSLAVISAVYDATRGALEYAPGATYVGMEVADVLAQGKGVCQDFAHLALALYRSLGIPARYVSGYFYAEDQSVGAEPDAAQVDVQTHAWVEVLVPGWGWWALDPTNPVDVGERHVKIGHGRDYDDVMPLRGVYHGPAEHALGVQVSITREQMTEFRRQQQAAQQ